MRRLLLGSVVLVLGCPKGPAAVDAAVIEDAGGADAGVEVAPVDAGPPAPVEFLFAIDFVGTDGGLTTVQSTAARAEIDPAQSILIQFPRPLKDFRVRMFDGSEQVLPSDEEARAEDGGMSYRITLAAPLGPGRSYSFSVDAELGHEITDLSGRGYRDVRVELVVRGNAVPEPKKKPAKKRR